MRQTPFKDLVDIFGGVWLLGVAMNAVPEITGSEGVVVQLSVMLCFALGFAYLLRLIVRHASMTASHWASNAIKQELDESYADSNDVLTLRDAREYGRPGNPDWEKKLVFTLKNNDLLIVSYDSFGGKEAYIQETGIQPSFNSLTS